jgi:hypothetical protein
LRPNQEKVRSTTQRRGSTTLHVVAPLDDLKPQHGDFGDGSIDLMGMVASVGPDKLQPREAVANFVEHESRAITVLHPGRVDDDAHRQALGVDERVDLAALHLLSGVVAYTAIVTAPFSADFTVWLSITAAVGLASRPRFSRKFMCRLSQIASQTPSRLKLRKML